MKGSLDSSLDRPPSDVADLSIAVVAGLALAVTAAYLCALPLAGHMGASRDFVEYWATGHQLVRHANPYDRAVMAGIERAAGAPLKDAMLMPNPPWALPLTYPLGFLGLRIAVILWSLILLACLVVSVHLVRQMHGSPANPIHWLGLSFTPALISLVMGQTSLFALLGLVLFLRYHDRRPFAAGAALWLCLLKPHLFLPFATALLAWMVMHRSYRILAGALAALAASSAAAYWIYPQAWARYLAMMRAPDFEQKFIPCLSDALRDWVRPQATWIQYLPAALCCVWALVYFWRRRHAWDWIRHGSLLMLVSILAAPYCFLYDQGLVIPALLDGAYATRSRTLLVVLAALIVAINLEFAGVRITSLLYLWTAPVWLAWYLLARATAGERAVQAAGR